MPQLQLTVRDDPRDITFEVYAYRPLTQVEGGEAIAMYLASRKSNPRPGSCIKVYTLIGKND